MISKMLLTNNILSIYNNGISNWQSNAWQFEEVSYSNMKFYIAVVLYGTAWHCK